MAEVPASPPSAKKIGAFLSKRLAELDPEEVVALFENGGIPAVPHWEYEHEGWHVAFFPIPKPPQARGKPGVRPIGIQLQEFKILETRDAIRDAVLQKAGRYGQLAHPYVIAVNVLSDHVDNTDAVEALFGYEQVVYKTVAGGLPQQPKYTRAPMEPGMARTVLKTPG